MSKITAAILIALSFLIYYTLTSSQYLKASELRAKVSEYQGVIDNASRIANTRDQLASAAETIPVVERERLIKALPKSIDSVGLARELDGIASQYGISIKNISIDKTSPDSLGIVLPGMGKPYERTAVSFSFVSNYDNFVKFLGDLEKSLRIMDVRTINFRTSETGLYEHSLTVDTYWLK